MSEKPKEFWIHNPNHRNTTASVWLCAEYNGTKINTEAAKFIEKSAYDSLQKRCERLKAALERIGVLYHAAYDKNSSAMDVVGEQAAIARQALRDIGEGE